MIFLVADFKNVIVHRMIYHAIASRHDVTSIISITILHLSYFVVWPYYDFYLNTKVIWVVGIDKIIDNIFASCGQHVTMSRRDVTMWRHVIFQNWSNSSMLSVSTWQLTIYPKYCSIVAYIIISTSSDEWNEICGYFIILVKLGYF